VQVNARAGGIEQIRAHIAAELAAARAELTATREDVADLDAARQRLTDARVDMGLLAAIAEAEAALSEAQERWSRAVST
jgi:hypothetical protein